MMSSARTVLAVVLAFLAVRCPGIGLALEEEGRALLGFRELIEVDPSENLLNWKETEGEVDPCALNEVCEDGRVVSLYRASATRSLQNKGGPSPPFNTPGLPTTPGSVETEKNYAPPPPPHQPEDKPFYPKHDTPTSRKAPPPPSPHLQLTPPPYSPPPPPNGDDDRSSPQSHKNDVKTLVYVLVGAVSGLMILTLTVIALFRIRKVLVKPWGPGLSEQLQKAFVAGLPQLKRSELETACEDFSNIVGTLTDGTLYKGTLSNGVEIGVNVLKTDVWPESTQAQFTRKVTTLSKVNHKNFINLIGYCEDEKPLCRMLVFEYAPNGMLYEHLHNIESHIYLNWSARMRVAMGVAYCLDYMHRLSPPIILGKLDSTSVHLTDDFAAKIADLELWSKTSELGMGSSEITHCPENVVYLFGMLLLELITGRPPFSEEMGSLISWAADYLDGTKPFKDAIDSAMGSLPEAQIETLFAVVKLCLNVVPAQRPTMETVAGMLKGLTSVNAEAAAPRLSPVWWAELEIISRDVA